MRYIPSIAFGIICRNSLCYLKQTLQKNLDDNRLFRHYVSFVIIDFGSNDGTKKWLNENFYPELKSQYLTYYYVDKVLTWNLARAKNTLYYWIHKDIVMDLMPNYYTGEYAGYMLLSLFEKYRMNIFCYSVQSENDNSIDSKIACLRNDFVKVGGYDENLETHIHVFDFIKRLELIGLESVIITLPQYNRVNRERIIFPMDEKFVQEDAYSYRNIQNGKLCVNNGFWGIRENVFDWSGKAMKF